MRLPLANTAAMAQWSWECYGKEVVHAIEGMRPAAAAVCRPARELKEDGTVLVWKLCHVAAPGILKALSCVQLGYKKARARALRSSRGS